MKVVNNPQHESGAALLAFMLILITGTSYLLVNQLSSSYIKAGAKEETRYALNQAKQALIGYAVMFPEIDAKSGTDIIDGPGYLPCPDITNNGLAGGSCSLTPSSTTSVGRLPYITLDVQDIKDSNGEHLWYIVSNNFRNNPKKVPLNSETSKDPSDSLTVNGIPDIAAVVLAPGEPQVYQNRNTGPNNYSNYLEITISGDAKSITISNTDDYILLTQDELMKPVEKRVLGEVKTFLSDYYSTYNAYPLLTPFADPKAVFRNISGTHSGSDNSSSLTDSSADFTDWNIQSGDIVINITDGSIGTVTSVTTNTINVSSMSLGNENDFDEDDQYSVIKTNWSTNILEGTAGGSTNNLILEDPGRDFEQLSISPGDVVENYSDGSSGVVESVSTDEITVKSLSGGSTNTFASGDYYIVRSNYGVATGSNNNPDLIDTSKDFITMGVQQGDLVVNLTDQSIGRVASVTNATTLAVDQMYLGTDNDFDTGDYYYLPRYNTDDSSREGLLSIHESGKLFPTAFNVNFNISADSSDIDFDLTSFPGVQPVYSNAVETYISNFVNSKTLSFGRDEGSCRWIVADIAECYGSFDDYVTISGRDTASVNSQTQITDATAQFTTDGVKRGDLAHNFDDETLVASGTADAGSTGTKLVDAAANFTIYEPYNYVIQNFTQEISSGITKIQAIITNVVDANTVIVENYDGESTEDIIFNAGDTYRIYKPRKDMVVTAVPSSTNVTISGLSATNPDFDAGEYYRIIPAAKSSDGSVDSTTPATCTASASCTITDADGDFLNKGIKVGDTIENTTSTPNAAFGEITSVTATTVTATLYRGTQNFFNASDNYTIYHDYVYSRKLEIRTRFSGNVYSHDSASTGIRKRDVCTGYTSDCSTVSAPAIFAGNGGLPLLTTHDYELDGTTEVGRATFIPTASSSGSLRVANIEYYLAESTNDIPDWFLRNKWYQLIYVAYSSGFVPGAAGSCTAGTDCLTLTGAGLPNDNKDAIVIIAGNQLATQNRSSANIGDYYELQNASSGDDTFQHDTISTTYNDQDRLIQ